MQVSGKEGKKMVRVVGSVVVLLHHKAQTVLGLSQGRIHSTESPNPTPSPLRETAGDRKRQQRYSSMTKKGD